MTHPRFKLQSEEELLKFEEDFIKSKELPSVKITNVRKKQEASEKPSIIQHQRERKLNEGELHIYIYIYILFRSNNERSS